MGKKTKIIIYVFLSILVILNLFRFKIAYFGDQKIIYFNNTMFLPFSNFNEGYAIGNYNLILDYGNIELKTGSLLSVIDKKILYLNDNRYSSYNIEIIGNKVENVASIVFSTDAKTYLINYSKYQTFNINNFEFTINVIIVMLDKIMFIPKDFSINITLKDNSVIYSEDGTREISVHYENGIYSFAIPKAGNDKEYYFIRENEITVNKYKTIRLNETWEILIEGIE